VSLRQLPNLISLLRILLVVPLAWLILREEYRGALWVFAVAALSDGLDGFLARRFGWMSRLGSILDPMGDKALLATSFFLLGWQGAIPWWLTLLVLGRDLVIVTGAVAFHFLVGRYDMAPSLASKLNTGAQLILVLLVVASLALGGVAEWAVRAMTTVVTITTLMSGAEYVWIWGGRAFATRRKGGGGLG